MADEPINERWEVGSNILHLTNADGGFQVWLNTEAGDYDGLIIGLGDTRQGALLDAAQTMNMALTELLTVIE